MSPKMLSWTQQSDGWHADGYHIVLEAPSRWVLTEDQPEPQHAVQHEDAIGYVSTPAGPLACARTLTEAKREAEIYDTAQYRAAMRRRHSAILLLTFAIGILFAGNSPTQNLVVLLVVAYVALRSIGVILGTWLWRLAGNARDVLRYQ